MGNNKNKQFIKLVNKDLDSYNFYLNKNNEHANQKKLLKKIPFLDKYPSREITIGVLDVPKFNSPEYLHKFLSNSDFMAGKSRFETVQRQVNDASTINGCIYSKL